MPTGVPVPRMTAFLSRSVGTEQYCTVRFKVSNAQTASKACFESEQNLNLPEIKRHIFELYYIVALNFEQTPSMRLVWCTAGQIHVTVVGKRAHVASIALEAIRCVQIDSVE